jgi:hypothetical protein
MERYGGNNAAAAKKFYEAWKQNPHDTGIKAAIDWWNHPWNKSKRQHAMNRNYQRITIGYLGGKGTWYGPTLERAAGIYRRQQKMGDTVRAATSARRIALIGDSNAKYLNAQYASHFSGDRTLSLHINGSGAGRWVQILRKVQSGNAGGSKMAQKLLDFKPDVIHVTSIGGNNSNRGETQAQIDAWVKNEVRPLFEIIKRYGGSASGAVQADPEYVKKKKDGSVVAIPGGERSWNVLRSRVNVAMAKAANSVGIPFWNPFTKNSYDTSGWAGKKIAGVAQDGLHLRDSAMAAAEFASRTRMLGGATSGPGGGAYIGSGGSASPTGAYDPDDPEGRLAAGEEEMAAAEKKRQVDAEIRKKFKSAFEKAFLSQFDPAMVAQGKLGPATQGMDAESFKADLAGAKDFQRNRGEVVAQAFEEQNAPTPDQLAATVDNPDQEIEAPSAEGVILKKYVKKLKQHQPDFNFNSFYEEVDAHLKGRSEEFFPKSGRDYVFGDEHWEAFVVVRNIKDKKQAVSESYSFLGDLVREIKLKW